MTSYICIAMLEDPPYNLIVAVTDFEPEDWCAKLPLPSHLLDFERLNNPDTTFKKLVRGLQIEDIKVETNKAFPAKPYEVIRVFKRILVEGIDGQEINTKHEELGVQHIANISDVEFTVNVKTPAISLYSARQLLIAMLRAKLSVSSFATPKGFNKFFIRQDGIAEDIETGLMWLRLAYGQTWQNGTVVGNSKRINWRLASEIADQFNRQGGFAGYSDWRLPTISELKTLVCRVKGKTENSLDVGVFPDNPPHRFWSSSPGAGGLQFLYFNFSDGVIGSRDCANSVRLVRQNSELDAPSVHQVHSEAVAK